MEPFNTLKLGRLSTPAEIADQKTDRVNAGLPTATGVLKPDDLVLNPDKDQAPPDWEATNRWQLGVWATDPVSHEIGMNAAKRGVILGKNWYPFSRFKHTLVGRLEQYGFYDGVGDEADWNLLIRPNPAFEFIRDDTLMNADLDKVHRASDGTILVEAEVTPDSSYFDNPFFSQNGLSPLVGRDVGVYGPWVMEEVHGMRPEIHPSQLLWWRDFDENGLAIFHLMVVQDDSQRFDETDQFSGHIARPWSAPPVHAEFRLAVSIPQNHGRRYIIEEVSSHHVQPSAPANGPFKHRENVGASSWIEWEKAFDNLRNVDVSLGPFVTADAGEERGFIVLRTMVGIDIHGKEGYQVLRVTELTGADAPRASAIPAYESLLLE